ncbi:MAG: TRM11 family SAM-dependent methyltransferase [Candidatus Thorarchaeota archaeon]
MTDLVFILGKNWLLSLAEMIVLLEDKGILKSLKDFSKTTAIVSLSEPVRDEDIVDIQSALGGCFKVGRLIETYDIEVARKAFPPKGSHTKRDRDLLSKCTWAPAVWGKPRGKKIKYGVSSYPSGEENTTIDMKRFTRGVNDFIKTHLLGENARRADYVIYDEPDRRDPSRSNTALWPQTISKHGLLKPPNAEILAAFTETNLYIAKTVAVYDSMLQQYRDESRPFISSEISTSPKICRTLLTIAGAKTGDSVLDPFCGTGTLLMEAALLEMKCIGIDLDSNAVEGAQTNLRWLGKELGTYLDITLIKGNATDADKLVGKEVDAIAFEPHLGPVYRGKPDTQEAIDVMEELTVLYRDTLKALVKILRPDGRIAMTVPVIRAKEKEITIDFNQMLKGTGLQLYRFLPEKIIDDKSERPRSIRINPNRGALPERKRGQVVQRQVIMLGRG